MQKKKNSLHHLILQSFFQIQRSKIKIKSILFISTMLAQVSLMFVLQMYQQKILCLTNLITSSTLHPPIDRLTFLPRCWLVGWWLCGWVAGCPGSTGNWSPGGVQKYFRVWQNKCSEDHKDQPINAWIRIRVRLSNFCRHGSVS